MKTMTAKYRFDVDPVEFTFFAIFIEIQFNVKVVTCRFMQQPSLTKAYTKGEVCEIKNLGIFVETVDDEFFNILPIEVDGGLGYAISDSTATEVMYLSELEYEIVMPFIARSYMDVTDTCDIKHALIAGNVADLDKVFLEYDRRILHYTFCEQLNVNSGSVYADGKFNKTLYQEFGPNYLYGLCHYGVATIKMDGDYKSFLNVLN